MKDFSSEHTFRASEHFGPIAKEIAANVEKAKRFRDADELGQFDIDLWAGATSVSSGLRMSVPGAAITGLRSKQT